MIAIDFETLRRIGLTHAIASQLPALTETGAAQLARIAEVRRDWLNVHGSGAELKASALPGLLQALREEDASLAVGDWVLVGAGQTLVLLGLSGTGKSTRDARYGLRSIQSVC